MSLFDRLKIIACLASSRTACLLFSRDAAAARFGVWDPKTQSIYPKLAPKAAGSYASWLAGDNLAPASGTPVGALRGAAPAAAANGGSATLAVRKFGAALKASLEEQFGPTLHLSAAVVELSFPTAFERLHTAFYRSKLTSWMAAQARIFLACCREGSPDCVCKHLSV